MRHEIRHDGGHQCATCGSYDLIYVAPHHEALVRDMKASFRAPWWRPFKRRWCRAVNKQLNGGLDEFVGKTRFPIVETPTSSTAGAAEPLAL